MKSFLFNSLPFILLFLIIRIVPNLVLDDFFYFRFWEKEIVNQTEDNLPFFTPNLDYRLVEEGDLNHGMDCSVKKTNHWFTDNYGLRNRDHIKNSDFIITGCSNALGSNCDYKSTFSGILSNKYSLYNISPDRHLNKYQAIFCREKPENIKRIFLVQVARYFTEKDQFQSQESVYRAGFNHLSKKIKRVAENHFGNKILSIFKKKKCQTEMHYYDTQPEIGNISHNIKTLTNRLVSIANIPVTIVVIPDKEFYRKGDTKNQAVYFEVLKNLALNGLDFIDVSDSLSTECYFHGDGHINEKGHGILAKNIEIQISSMASRNKVK